MAACRPLRRPAHAGQGDRAIHQPSNHAPLSGTADNKDIDCIIAAVPDHWHKRSWWMRATPARTFTAKSRCRIPPRDGVDMVEAAKKNGRIVQIGSQRVSSVLCAKANELYRAGRHRRFDDGRSSRSGATIRPAHGNIPPPPDLSPQTLDWDTWLGTTRPRAPSTHIILRAGAAGRSTARGWPAI